VGRREKGRTEYGKEVGGERRLEWKKPDGRERFQKCHS
jgi:hypothetical protein